MENKGYVVYTAVKCPWCSEAMKLLIKNKLDFKVVSVKDNDDALRFLSKQGLSTVPQVFQEGKLIGGYEDLEKHLGSKE